MNVFRSALRIALCCALVSADSGLSGEKHLPSLEPPSVNVNEFDRRIIRHTALSSDDGANMVALTHPMGVYTSSNNGADWAPLEGVEGESLFKSDNNMFHMFSSDPKFVYVSWDGAKTREKIKLPTKVRSAYKNALLFHPTNTDCMLFVDVKQKTNQDLRASDSVSYISKDRGNSWTKMFEGKCQFMPGDQDLVYCAVPEPEITGMMGKKLYPRKLFWSTDFFASPAQTFDELQTVAGLTKAGKFIVALSVDENNKVSQVASVDGKNFQPIVYPSDCMMGESAAIVYDDESSLWLFDSHSRSVFKTDSDMHALKVIDNVAYEHSPLGPSTQFAPLNIEGTALANILGPRQEETVITHDNGATWSPLTTEDGQRLHIRGLDDQKTFPVAGMHIGYGDIGEQNPNRQVHTVMTRDGGVTWKEIAPYAAYWAFADSGSTIVLFQVGTPTNTVRYSTDDGMTWSDFKFSEDRVYLDSAISVPGDKSQTVTLSAYPARSENSLVYQLDFTSQQKSMCTENDYEWWSSPICLDGQQIQYKRKIAGRQCVVNDDLTEKRVQSCGSTNTVQVSAAQDQVKVSQKTFDSRFKDYLYIPGNSETVDEETVLAWTSKGDLYVSSNQGSDWILQKDVANVMEVFKSETDDNQIYVYTQDSSDWLYFYVSWDRAKTFEKVQIPSEPLISFAVSSDILTFHPKNKDWMLYNGKKSASCDSWNCESASYVSKDKGKTWKMFATGNCRWVYGLDLQDEDEELVFCTVMNTAPPPVPTGGGGDDDDDFFIPFDQVFWSTDYFETGPQSFTGLERTVGLASAGKFYLALSAEGRDSIKQVVTRDGRHFEPLKYPANVEIGDETTLLTFDESSLWTFSAISKDYVDLYGSLFKSDAEGSNNIKVLDNVNKASGFFSGYVDFDRLESVEGVALANVVVNPDDVMRKGAEKQLRTMITHSDGSMWAPLSIGKGQKLNLHGYTERLDRRNKPSSPTAVGVFMGRGNIGETLGELRLSQTYMTRDAGMTWTEVAPRPMYWELGDSGSIIVLVDSLEPTDSIRYSVDDGLTWADYTFSEYKVKIVNLATIPSDTSRKFIIFATAPLSVAEGTIAFQLDFSEQVPLCKDNDYEWWTPEHPQLKSQCLLGRETQYKRKIAGRKCSVGKYFSDPNKKATFEKNVKNCKCTTQDLECDFNYEQKDGKCVLVQGATEPTKKVQCADGRVAYRNTNGYRLISSSTCEGADQLVDMKFYACPGKDTEFREQYGDGTKGRIAWPDQPPTSPGKPPTRPSPPSKVPDPSKPTSSSRPNKPSPDPEAPKKKVRRWTWVNYFLMIGSVSTLAFIVFMWYTRKWLQHVWNPRNWVQLPEYDGPVTMDRSRDVLQKVFAQAQGVWDLIRVNVPFFGSRLPQDHLGFYSRMSDDDRYQFDDEDDEEDNFEADEDVPFTDADHP